MKVKLKGDNILEIKFDYDPELVSKMRSLEGHRIFDKKTKSWICHALKGNIAKLTNWGFEIDKKVKEATSLTGKRIVYPEIEVPGFKKIFYPFQVQGVSFLETKGGNGIIADEMGLGKTIQALGWIQLHPEIRPVVIICPASLKLNWRDEINACLSKRKATHIIEGQKPYRFPQTDIYIINYDIVAHHVKSLISLLNPQVIILDEGHYIKNGKRKRTIAIKELTKNIRHKIILTGTPIENKPAELFNQISLINPKLFPSFFQYAKRYCGAQYTGFGWNFSGASNKEELHSILTSSCMIRRLKSEVLPDLPQKIRTVVPLKIDNIKEYRKAEKDFSAWLKKNGKGKGASANALAQIEYLKQICIKGKMKWIIQWIENYLDQEEKLVVIATHRKTIRDFRRYFKERSIKTVKLVGGMEKGERHRSVKRFQTKKNIRIFFGNIKAAGVGITLTAANSLIMTELGWNPSAHDQAEDRIHRIGQKDACSIYYFIAEGTIEEDIIKLIDEKRETVTAILDGKEVEENTILSELLMKYGKKEGNENEV